MGRHPAAPEFDKRDRTFDNRIMRMPVVAIVGRPNVGKSSLLNALSGRRISIVQDQPGVTRDRVSTPWQIAGKWVELVDTGGYGFDDSQGLTEHIRHQIEIAMARADLVLFVVDCTTGPTAGDEQIARLLRRLSARVLLVANKADNADLETSAAEFARLGFGTPLGVSAISRRQIDRLVEQVAATLDLSEAPVELPAPQMQIAIVGKRNAGKSTLVNTIVRIFEGEADERVIVSEVPGTTRDSVDVRIEKEGKTLVVIDTAGVRKKRHMVTNDLEYYSFHRAQRSIRRADVVLQLIDATDDISEPDKKLAQYILQQHKPVVLVLNKWDLARQIHREQNPGKPARDQELMRKYTQYVNADLRHLDFAPIAFITAKDGKNVPALLDLAQHLFKQANQRVTTGRLNAALRQALSEQPPSARRGARPKVYYATQIGVAPPTIVLKVNHVENFPETYQRYLIHRLRELLPYSQVPIRLIVRGKDQKETAPERLVDEEVSFATGSGKGGSAAPSAPAEARTDGKRKSAAQSRGS
ncbi:MAG: ribosome biogenesis GTPase Der [Phycisphaerales bacterium]|nr:ribosome biogenesis GTPase Der [Phycisphaerales bacterium]